MTSWAFLGAGEFEDWHDGIDVALLDGRGDRVLVFATAAAPEGDDVFDRWASQGIAHYVRLGVDVTAPPLKRREDAHDPAIVDELDEASLVFFSGGNPSYLAAVLAGSPFWERLRARVAEGTTAYVGCSAGVAALSDPTYDSDTDDLERVWVPGLGHFADVLFAPHWDVIDGWVPGARSFITASAPPDGVLVAIDERTAMSGDGERWQVHGSGGVHLYRGDAWSDHGDGDTFDLPLRSAGEPGT